MAKGDRMKIGTLVNFIPPHSKPIPLIQGIIIGIVEKAAMPGAKPTTHYEVQWLSGVRDPGVHDLLPCQLEVAS